MLAWSLLLFFLLTFLLVTIALVVVFLVIQKGAAQRAEEKLDQQDLPSGDEAFDRLLKSEELSSISILHSLLARFDFIEILKKQMLQSALGWSVGRLILATLFNGTVALCVLVRLPFIPLWVATGGSWLLAMIPYFYVLGRRRRRFEKFREVFPDALDSLARGLRAGYPLVSALELVANEAEEPVAGEIRKTFVEANLGMPWEQVLNNFAERVPLPEVSLFVAAVQIHQRTGGRLSDVMTRLTDTMREQVALSGEVRAIAAHGRITGLVLTIVPIGIAGLMFVVTPDYIGVLLGHPYGHDMIAAAIGCLVLAHFVMRRLTDIKL